MDGNVEKRTIDMKKYFTKKDIVSLLFVYVELYALCVSHSFITDSMAFKILLSFWQTIRGSVFMWLISCLAICVFVFYAIVFVKKTKDTRWSDFLLYFLSILFLFDIFSETSIIDLMLLLEAFFVISTISIIWEYFHKGNTRNLSEDFYKKGFSSDVVSLKNKESLKWDDFSNKLLQKLLHTNIERSSFAVALTGGWGTGKTTFLELFKADLKKKGLSYLTFNPWLSNSPDKIIKDYFVSLKSKLEDLGLYVVGKDIDKYMNLLLAYTAPTLKDEIFDIFDFGSDENLVSLRDDISEKLGDLSFPLFVLIDDVDRLRKDEIFETLKLIRNTADFRNIIYVVTYDKEYVVQSLDAYNIINARDFLKKIFQIELKFPKYEKYLLNHNLFKEINNHSQITNYRMREALDGLEICLQGNVFIGDYLQNFRDVKRFANEFSLVLEYIDGQKVWEDFELVDLFLIELLNYTDESTYLKLKNGYMSVLGKKDDVIYYEANNDNKEIDRNSMHILKLLFPKNLQTSECKINNVNRFYTYFSYRPYAYQIGLTEFKDLLKTPKEEDVKERISKMNDGVFSKAESLYTLMLNTKLDDLDNKSLLNYIVLMIEWTRQNQGINKEYIANLYGKVALLSKDFDNDIRVEVHSKLTSFFKEVKRNIGYFCIIQRILSEFEYRNKNVSSGTIAVFNRSEIQDLLHKNTTNFLCTVKPQINQLIDDSRLHDYVMQSIGYVGDNIHIKRHPYKLLIEDELIQYFGKNTKHNYRVFFSRFEYEECANNRDGLMPAEIQLENKIKSNFCTIDFELK